MIRRIYLHGFASGPASKKATYFRDRLPGLLVPDLAEGNFEGLTISAQLRVVERLAEGEPADLIGSSMGGYVAALYAARHPEVRRLVLMAPAFGFARRWPLALGEQKVRQWHENGWMEVFHYSTGQTARIGYQLLEDGSLYEDYPDVRQPALVFHGRQDTVVPCQFSVEFGASRPNARIVLVDSGHELTNVLESVWEESYRFLNEPGR